MKLQHLSEETHLDYLTGEMSVEQQSQFRAHLQECAGCRAHLQQYQDVVQNGLPSIADESNGWHFESSKKLPWSMEDGKQKLLSAAAREYSQSLTEIKSEPLDVRAIPQRAFIARLSAPLAIAAAILLAAGVAVSTYYLGTSHRHDSALSARQLAPDHGPLNAQLRATVAERDAAQAALQQRDSDIMGLKAQILETQKHLDAANSNFQSEQQKLRQENQELAAQDGTLTRTLEEQQSALADARQKLETLERAANGDALHLSSLENQNHLAAQLLQEKDAEINRQQQMLAADRDIRELMGERDLLMAEVYDVGANGKRNKPYGRVFYTKGKSLIFYAYDLDQAPGIKNPSTFQAWGMRGPDRDAALNLGVMYVDNSSNKRWVLRFDDQQTLQQINAVFVTVEPNGKSRAPRGKQVLFAFLDEVPNHP